MNNSSPELPSNALRTLSITASEVIANNADLPGDFVTDAFDKAVVDPDVAERTGQGAGRRAHSDAAFLSFAGLP